MRDCKCDAADQLQATGGTRGAPAPGGGMCCWRLVGRGIACVCGDRRAAAASHEHPRQARAPSRQATGAALLIPTVGCAAAGWRVAGSHLAATGCDIACNRGERIGSRRASATSTCGFSHPGLQACGGAWLPVDACRKEANADGCACSTQFIYLFNFLMQAGCLN